MKEVSSRAVCSIVARGLFSFWGAGDVTTRTLDTKPKKEN